MRKPISPEDLAKYKSLSAPSFSPDGSRIALSVHQTDMEGDVYSSEIWIVNTDGSGQSRFTTGGKDSDPTWSPDGKSILFVSKRSLAKDEKGNELYAISSSGGEARRLAKRKEGVDSPMWSPDCRQVAFLSSVMEGEQNDVRVIDRIPFWFNGMGWTYNAHKHLFVMGADGGTASQLTQGDFDVSEFAFSNDGKRIAYLASVDRSNPQISDLFVLDLDTKETKKLSAGDMEMAGLDWSKDDQLIAFGGDKFPLGFASNSHIWLVSSSGGSLPRAIDTVDRNKSNSLNTDVRAKAHGPQSIKWTDGFIHFFEQDGGSAHLYRMKPGASPELVVGGDVSVEGMDVLGGKVAYIAQTSTKLEELYLKREETVKLTDFNASVYEECDIIEPLRFEFKASDGEKIEGWVLLPRGTEAKVPSILYVHGGPKTSFGNSYMHELQVFAAAGYAVIFMNPRGSDGYTEKFADIRGDYGNRDFKDLMEGLDYVLKAYPSIDGDRVGIAGGSYGGFMTNWAIGHTDRFKAAVTDRSIATWESFFGTSDIGVQFTKDQIGGDPWKMEKRLTELSPLKYVENVSTPLLVVHSMEDYRCWMVEGLQMFTALKYLGKPAEMVLFAGENHDLSRVGKPKHRVARLKQYLRWFDKYLKDAAGASK